MATSIKTLRARIGSLKREAKTIEDIRYGREELRTRIEGYAEFLAAEAEPYVRHVISGAMFGGSLAGVFRVAGEPGGGIDAGKLFAAVLGPKAIADALCSRLDAMPDGADAATRAARLVEINHELDELEREEERMIEASELTGAPIARRPDARPEIVLVLVSA